MSKNLEHLIEDSADLLKLILKILLLPEEENEPSGTRNPDENENNERHF